jgi:hypothetical protein
LKQTDLIKANKPPYRMDLFTSVSTILATPSFTFTFMELLILSAISMSTGYLIRIMQRNKSKGKLLKLEDEMLRNHAKILSLEKNITDLKKENNQLKNIYARRTKESQGLSV